MTWNTTKGASALAMMILALGTAACGSSVVLDADGDGIPDDEDPSVTPPDGGDGASGPGTEPACAPGSGATEIAPWKHASNFIAAHDGWVYWTIDGAVERAPEKGGGPVDVIWSGDAYPTGIDVDDSGVYFVVEGGSVARVDHGGGPTTAIAEVNDLGGAFAMVRIDDTHAYFRRDCAHLARVPKGGGAVEVIAETDGCLGGLALDGERVFFYDYDTGRVGSAAKDGGDAVTLVEADLARAGGYTGAAPGLFVDDDAVYWVSADEGFVGRVPKGGGPMIRIAEGVPLAQDVIAAGGFVYWSEKVAIRRAPATGGSAITLTDGIDGVLPMGLAIDGDRLFFTNYVTNGAVLGVCR